jgi:uncharacterized protein (DUF305 family)
MTTYAKPLPHAAPAVRSRRWYAALVALLALVVGVGIGLVAARAPEEGSAEVTFARDMTAHHAQAVEMALLIRDRSSDPDLRQFAIDIILTQQAQLGQMEGWLNVWGVPLRGAAAEMGGHGAMMGMATQDEIARLGALPLPEAEVLFLQLMMRHHQGGIYMAEDVLAETQRPEVRRIAEAIVAGQQRELEVLRVLLQRRGGSEPAPLERMDHS